MRSWTRRLPPWASALGCLLLHAESARAFERAHVEGNPDTALAWPRRDLALWIASETSDDVAPDDLVGAVRRSLATWSGAGGCTDIALRDEGEPSGLRTNLMGGAHDLENRIVFREVGWPAELGPETLAITTIVYRRTTGEILDADVDVNAVDNVWSAAPVPPEGTHDVENTITHEIGHFLGFAHVADPEATMFGASEPGDVAKRDLAPDDVRAVCTVYPAGRRTPGGEGPRGSLASGCAAAPPARADRSASWAPWALAGLTGFARTRRARRAR